MEAVILNTVWVGTIHYTSGIMKSKVENLYNIFCNNETRSRYPLWVMVVHTLEEFKAEYPFNLGDYVFMAGYTDPVEISGIGWSTGEVRYEVYTGDYNWVSVDSLFPVIKDQASRRSSHSQNEVNRYLLENPIRNAQELLAIEKELALALMSLPENITIHSRGINSKEFLEWFYSDPISTDDIIFPMTYEAW